jgi:5-methylcytosine-specific restriction endonuclease McrA
MGGVVVMARSRDNYMSSAEWKLARSRAIKAAPKPYVCGLCYELIDVRVRWPDPRSLSVDHVVPRIYLPRHEWSELKNLQLAHLGCNTRKRDGRRKPKPSWEVAPPSRDW